MSELFPSGNTALFSPCRTYRYDLWRRWDETLPVCTFIGLNPSTADETVDDPTIRRCLAYAWLFGCGSLRMLNLFAFRATDPNVMMQAPDPVGPDNNSVLAMAWANKGPKDITIAAWGRHGKFMDRQWIVARVIGPLQCLSVNSDGSPGHPLYLKRTLTPRPWDCPPLSGPSPGNKTP